jgi:hypothetical protein
VNFSLQLSLQGIHLSGMVCLHTSPYEAERAAIYFPYKPHIEFGISSSDMIVGNSTVLPVSWQKKISNIIETRIKLALSDVIESKLCTSDWLSISLERSQMSVLLEKWLSIVKYPFLFNGTDDSDMMIKALHITTQAEAVMSETVNAMKAHRMKLQRFVLNGEEMAQAAE